MKKFSQKYTKKLCQCRTVHFKKILIYQTAKTNYKIIDFLGQQTNLYFQYLQYYASQNLDLWHKITSNSAVVSIDWWLRGPAPRLRGPVWLNTPWNTQSISLVGLLHVSQSFCALVSLSASYYGPSFWSPLDVRIDPLHTQTGARLAQSDFNISPQNLIFLKM